MHVGKLCRDMTIKAVDGVTYITTTVKDLDALHAKQVARAGMARVIGVDEISISKGHDYQVIDE